MVSANIPLPPSFGVKVHPPCAFALLRVRLHVSGCTFTPVSGCTFTPVSGVKAHLTRPALLETDPKLRTSKTQAGTTCGLFSTSVRRRGLRLVGQRILGLSLTTCCMAAPLTGRFYSPTGHSKHLLEPPFLDPPSKNPGFGEPFFPFKAHYKAPSKTPSENLLQGLRNTPISEQFL